MNHKSEKLNALISLMLIFSIISLFIENGLYRSESTLLFTSILDYIILLLFITEIVSGFVRSKYKAIFLRQNAFEIAFLVILSTLFLLNKYVNFLIDRQRLQDLGIYIIILRNVFVVIKMFGRVKRLNTLIKNIADQPAQTVVLSFIAVITVGTLFLMMPFATADNTRLGFIDSLFTATSAVCVTGLIVVDTATRFSLIGKIILLILIQIGGLGIMVLSYFLMFLLRKQVSVERSLIISYMLNEDDMTLLYDSIKKIVRTTFIIELVGFMFLAIPLSRLSGMSLNALFYALFHSVSAFCNAGFSLFTENLAGFTSDIPVNITIAGLIILGGIGFSVIINVLSSFRKTLRRIVLKRREKMPRLSLNTRVVLITSGILIVLGMLLIYASEHGNSLIDLDIKTQYLAAFFQSVTLRTAGFNTIDFTALNRFTYLLMIVFMFIGGASGSTAGGVKVNTISVVGGYIKSIIQNREEVTIFNQSISTDLINKAFSLLFLHLTIIFLGNIVLTMTERFEATPILFEVVSALGTVGLSAGITPYLTTGEKVVVTMLMVIGRVGPLTVVAALSQRKRRHPITYPQGHITIG